MDSLSLSKAEIRVKYRALRKALETGYRQNAESTALSRLIALEEFGCADTILLYYPVKSELNVLPILSAAREAGKSVALPKCDKETLTMRFFEIRDESELQLGAYGIPEPKENCPEAHCSERSLCIVPALVFSREGHRIGYGKGFYDKFLSGFSGKSAGITWEALMTDKLPFCELDRKLDMTVTEKGVYRFEN